MAIHADAHFVLGRDHAAQGVGCQDYAGHGEVDGQPGLVWAAVADGCSSVGAPTDVGARLAVAAFAAAVNGIRTRGEREVAGRWLDPAFVAAVSDYLAHAPVLFHRDEQLATLAGVVADGQRAEAILLGDGVVALRDRQDRLHLWELSFPSNMPWYVAYAGRPGAAAAWHARQGDPPAWLVYQCLGPDGEPLHEAEPRAQSANMLMSGVHLSLELADWDVQSLSVLSDGGSRVGDLGLGPTVRVLTAYKTLTGAFQRRRSIRALQEWERAGQRPADDLAIASLVFELEDTA